MATQHLFAFESTRRHKSGLTDVKADRRKDTDQIKQNRESEKKKESRDEKKKELDLDCVTWVVSVSVRTAGILWGSGMVLYAAKDG